MTDPPPFPGPPAIGRPFSDATGGPAAGACLPPGLDLRIGEALPPDIIQRFGGRAGRVRILRRGDRITMDHIADRLNIVVDDRGRIVQIYCG